jgi:hypothetical protein
MSSVSGLASAATPLPVSSAFIAWFGYLWLLCGSVYFLVRCFWDLTLVRRPALGPNMNLSGLAWLGAALFVCLVVVAVRKPSALPALVGKRSVAVNETQRRAEDLVKQEIVAAAEPGFDLTFWVEFGSAILCHAAIVAGLAFIGWRHFQDAHAGVAAATFYLLLPYTAYHVEQVHHVLPAALLIWAVAAYRQPTCAGLLLGLATGAGYFPALLVPVWFSFYWRAGAGRFLSAFLLAAGLSLALVAGFFFMDGTLARSIEAALSLSDWQPWQQPSAGTKGFWTSVTWAWAYRLPVFIVYIAFVVATLFWPARKTLAHVIALSAAVVIGIQFWFADQGGVYLLWYLPLLLLLVFRPNLSDRLAAPIHPETDWLTRYLRRAGRLLMRLLHPGKPLARVH